MERDFGDQQETSDPENGNVPAFSGLIRRVAAQTEKPPGFGDCKGQPIGERLLGTADLSFAARYLRPECSHDMRPASLVVNAHYYWLAHVRKQIVVYKHHYIC